MAVGGDKAHRVRSKDEQRGVQKVACVLDGYRKLRLRDHFAQGGTRQRGGRRRPGFGQRGKVFARQRLHARIEPVGGDFDAALVFRDPDVCFRQRFHDLVELLGGKRQRAALRYGCLAPAAQPHLQVSGKKAHLVALRFHQHVGKDRNRVLALHDPLEKLQFSQKVVLSDDKFHGCADLERRSLRAPVPLRRGKNRE